MYTRELQAVNCKMHERTTILLDFAKVECFLGLSGVPAISAALGGTALKTVEAWKVRGIPWDFAPRIARHARRSIDDVYRECLKNDVKGLGPAADCAIAAPQNRQWSEQPIYVREILNLSEAYFAFLSHEQRADLIRVMTLTTGRELPTPNERGPTPTESHPGKGGQPS